MMRMVRRQPVVGGVLAIAVIGLALWLIWLGLAAGQTVAAANRLMTRSVPPEQYPRELARLSAGLDRLSVPVFYLDPLTRPAVRLPLIGDEIGGARALLGVAVEGARGAAAAAPLGQPDPSIRGERTFGALPVLVRRMREEPERAARAADYFTAAVQARRDWPSRPELPPLRAATNRVDDLLPSVAGAGVALPHLAGALGASGPRTYLIVAQNNREIRPGGGFIGTYALVTIDQGNVTDMQFGDSYELDGSGGRIVLPPDPLRKFGGIPVWLFRDANWSADFPTNAARLQEFFERDRPVQLDGVIAVDVTAFQALLEATGPVEIPEFGETVSADNLIEKTDQHVTYQGAGGSRHKAFLGGVAEQLADRVLPPEPGQAPDLAGAVWRMLRTKHIQVALDQQELQTAIETAGLAGSLHHAPDDALQVVDANLGYNKANGAVERSVAHSVQLHSGGGADVTLTVNYQYSGARDGSRVELYDEYRNFVRVLLPPAARMRSVEGVISEPELSHEAGKLVVGGFLRVKAGEEESFQVRYFLPGVGGDDRGYSLVYQEQAGMTQSDFRVTVVGADGQTLLDWQGEALGDWYFRAGNDPAVDRMPAVLLAVTDGSLARFVGPESGRDAVDNLQGGGYTGLGLMVGEIGSMGIARLVGQPDEGGETEARPATLTHSMLARNG